MYLSNNYIQHLEGLSKLRIRILDLHNNEIKSNETEAFYELNGLHNLRELREVDLSYNFKTSLKVSSTRPRISVFLLDLPFREGIEDSQLVF